MPEQWLLQHGLPALFLLSFAASTLLPLGSEWLLVALLAVGKDPLACVLTATVGNTLGALTSYLIGFYGADWLNKRVLRISPDRQRRAARWYQQFGSWSLLFSWLPIIGDPLCLLAGYCRVPVPWFLLLTGTGKGARYLSVAGLAGLFISP
ncbi:YqaA family protein [Geothermobacter hydrogeniphilus]|uniref:VTT domain-containing protein n=1 Tax=Geothermobacter hydrogeniphilus TaxID=1969733 RepID=A0A1X0YCT4_9BACT|nr:YqaA family protein [Geothermobacter hydrogeniphilus]ORJ62893.1 hypothetical protein B5V00_02215 [Geothermobacter hydrogeniphilus]